METLRNGTQFSTRSPAKNVTEVVYVSREDVTELTIIVWTVGGVLLITLLALLGRIMLARRKDPFSQMNYQRHRRNVLRIRIDSEYLAHPTEHGFIVPRDTTDLVTCASSTPSESPVSQRTQNREHQPARNISQISRNSLQHVVQSNDALNSNGDSNNAEIRSVYDVEANTDGQRRQSTPDVSNRGGQISLTSQSACTSNSHSAPDVGNNQNTDHLENSQSQETANPQNNVSSNSNTTTQCSASNENVGSRVLLSNGVVISPPPYCDVINTNARLPSVIVSRPTRPPSRRILFSL